MDQKFVYFDRWGDVPITLDSRAVAVFTEGNCGALAYAVNFLTGWQIIISNKHAANRTPAGQVLDITGCQTLKSFEYNWGKSRVVSRNSKQLLDYGVNEWRAALPFAKLLLQKYFPEHAPRQSKINELT
jgi:hypothetical protein